MLKPEADEPRTRLSCPTRLRETRRALRAAEWVWREKRAFPKDNQELFAAQFVLGKALAASGDVNEPLATVSIDPGELSTAPTAAAQSVTQHELIERDSPFQARLRGWLRNE
jgi:hypothetical protein